MPRKHTARGRKQLARAPKHRSRVATANNSIVTRQFRYKTQVGINTPNTANQGGVEEFFIFANPISDYAGSQYISQNHEQFRVKRIKLLARPSTGLYPAPRTDASIATVIDTLQLQISQYNLTNFTEVQSYIDYDATTAPQFYDELLIRPNLKIQCLKPTTWTMVANFTPRTVIIAQNTASPNLVLQSHEWQSTNYLGANLNGVSGRFTNRYNAPLLSLPLIQGIDIFAIATVEMRGVRNSNCTTTTISRGLGGFPAALPYIDYVESQDSDEELVNNIE